MLSAQEALLVQTSMHTCFVELDIHVAVKSLLASKTNAVAWQIINTLVFCRGYYHRLLAPYLQDIQLLADAQQTAEPVHSKAGEDDMQDDDRRAEADGPEPAVSAKLGDTVDKGGLDVSAIQQHSAIISARLQSRPHLVDLIDTSDSEDPLDQPPPLPADFKATVVDASGPIPGLEDL